MSANAPQLEQWSSTKAFILATAGAAIGLGNIWKFPYMLGANGGSAFLVVYLCCIVVIGLPLMITEILLGRMGGKIPPQALQTIAKRYQKTTVLSLVGYLGLLGLIIILSFYSVVAGWCLAYIPLIPFGHTASINTAQTTLNTLLASSSAQIFSSSIFLGLTTLIVAKGLIKGLERTTKYLMPAMLILLVLLVVYALIVGDSKSAFHFLFHFEASALTPSVILAAMGHAFFTLALGAGAILNYGSHLKSNVKIPITVLTIASYDTLVSVIIGLAIFPIVFASNFAPDLGQTLIFETLPVAFGQMPGGSIIGCLFFVFLFIAALTSSINIAQPVVDAQMHYFGFSRAKAALTLGGIAWLLASLGALSFNHLGHIQLFSYSIFGFMTNIVDKLILPMGGLVFAIYAGWIIPSHASAAHLPWSGFWFSLWLWITRIIAPGAILLIWAQQFLG